MLVNVIKNKNDINKPDLTEIETLFMISQMIKLKYDTPKTNTSCGYSQKTINSSVNIGEFKVTDIFCNMLVYPHENMIELESQDEVFDELYPREKIMLIFENTVVNRLVQ